MDTTPNLGLPYLAAAQSQKHVTHNEAIRALDALVQLTVVSRTLTAPPATLTDGNRYIVAAGGTGAWAGQSLNVAAWQDGAWMFYPARAGWLVWIAAESVLTAFNGTQWVLAGGGIASINPVPLVGINTTADTTNRLSVKSPATLFDNVGTGHQLKVNKASPTDTASLLYQDNYSGRAEIGLTGDDKLHVKVSADGSTWKESINIDPASGIVSFPSGTTITGTAGPQGPAGPAGAPGTTGPAGAANVLSVGTVNTGAAGSAAAATITGIAPSQTLNLTIPQGAAGSGGGSSSQWATTGTAISYTGGKVGIGTSTPATLLQIGTGTPTNPANGIQFGDDTGAYIYRNSANNITIGGNLNITNSLTVGNALFANNFLNSTNAGVTLTGGVIILQNGTGQPLIKGSFNSDTIIAPARNDANFLGDVVVSGGGANVERARFMSSGNIGFGVAAPTTALHVKGAIRSTPATLAATQSASSAGAGSTAFVTDSTMPITTGLGLAVVGGDSKFVPVYSDGTNWIIG